MGDDDVYSALRAAGFQSFKSEEQARSVIGLVAGHDVFAALPTGAGKTQIFRLATAVRGGVGVVVCPLLALIEDQLLRATRENFKAVTFNGATSANAKAAIKKALVEGEGPSLLYVTAEMASVPSFHTFYAELVAAGRLALLCVDEAHVSCAWAEDFRPAYGRIVTLREMSPSVPLLMLTATCSTDTIGEICELLGAAPSRLLFRVAPRRQNLFVDVIRSASLAQPEANVVAYIARVLARQTTGVAILYCRSKDSCALYAQRFVELNVPACLYHGDRSAAERSRAQQKWTNETIRVVIATVAFGLGIDKSNVRCVVHVDLPTSLHCYAQQIGRAGRDGERAYCRVYLSPTEGRSAVGIVQQERQRLTAKWGKDACAKARIDRRCAHLTRGFKEVQEFAESGSTCRHQRLDTHFGFAATSPCLNNCDVCVKK